MSRVKLWVGLAVLFGAGVVTGIVGTSFYEEAQRTSRGERGPRAQHERIMKRLTRELSLTPQQRSEIEPVVTRAHTGILELRFAHQAEIEEILTKGMADIKAKLSREQQTALDNMYAGLERRWQVSRSYLEAQKRSPASQP